MNNIAKDDSFSTTVGDSGNPNQDSISVSNQVANSVKYSEHTTKFNRYWGLLEQPWKILNYGQVKYCQVIQILYYTFTHYCNKMMSVVSYSCDLIMKINNS